MAAGPPRPDFQVGRNYNLTGYVTVWRGIIDLSPSRLTMQLGFAGDRLRSGFAVLLLDEEIKDGDFVWSDETRFAQGFKLDLESGEYVRAIDLLRASSLIAHGEDAAADADVRSLLAGQIKRLNTRNGPNRICKVVPRIAHDPKVKSWIQYPDSPFAGIPQWDIVKAKRMVCIARVPPGASFSG